MARVPPHNVAQALTARPATDLARNLLSKPAVIAAPEPAADRLLAARPGSCRTSCDRWSRSRGFTLIELMTVVVILGVLAAVAIAAYSRQVRNAHKTEVISDLSNLSLRQRSFRAVQGHYASSTNCEGPGCTYPLASNIAVERGPIQWDVQAVEYTRDGQGDAEYFRGGGALHGFDALRFLPDAGNSWCGYATISGHGTQSSDPETADEPPTTTLANQVFPSGSDAYYARDWFFSYALCDFDFDGEYWAFTATHYEDEVNYGTDQTNTYRENE